MDLHERRFASWPAFAEACPASSDENVGSVEQIEGAHIALIADIHAEVALLGAGGAYPPFEHWGAMVRGLDPTLKSYPSLFEILVETIIRHEMTTGGVSAVIDRILPWLCATTPIFAALTESSAVHEVEMLDGASLAWMATPRDVSPAGLDAFGLVSRLAHHLDGQMVRAAGAVREFGVTGIRTAIVRGQERVVCVAFGCKPLG